jgi:hypothetical protein
VGLQTAGRYHVIYSSNHETKHVTVNGQACHHSTSNHPSRGVATHSVGLSSLETNLVCQQAGPGTEKTPSSHLRYQISVRSLQISPRAWELGTTRQGSSHSLIARVETNHRTPGGGYTPSLANSSVADQTTFHKAVTAVRRHEARSPARPAHPTAPKSRLSGKSLALAEDRAFD